MRGATAIAYENARRRVISIHAPHAGRDPDFPTCGTLFTAPFQSTRPMRGATKQRGFFIMTDFISIHAPHAGRDSFIRDNYASQVGFQSTRPMRGATVQYLHTFSGEEDFNPRAPCGARRAERTDGIQRDCISIHAPHAGRDCLLVHIVHRSGHFNPRAPCGARRSGVPLLPIEKDLFQSTRPMRGATTRGRASLLCLIHFNPRAPCGARPLKSSIWRYDTISIHAPHAGRDSKCP